MRVNDLSLLKNGSMRLVPRYSAPLLSNDQLALLAERVACELAWNSERVTEAQVRRIGSRAGLLPAPSQMQMAVQAVELECRAHWEQQACTVVGGCRCPACKSSLLSADLEAYAFGVAATYGFDEQKVAPLSLAWIAGRELSKADSVAIRDRAVMICRERPALAESGTASFNFTRTDTCLDAMDSRDDITFVGNAHTIKQGIARRSVAGSIAGAWVQLRRRLQVEWAFHSALVAATRIEAKERSASKRLLPSHHDLEVWAWVFTGVIICGAAFGYFHTFMGL